MTNQDGQTRLHYKVRAGMNALVCPHCEQERKEAVAHARKKAELKTCGTLFVNVTLTNLARLQLAGQHNVTARCEGVPYNGTLHHTANIVIRA